jgi:hypothetical protein
MGVLFFTFWAIFPRKLFRSRWAWVLVWAPVALYLPLFANFTYRMVYQPERSTGQPLWFFASTFFTGLPYMVGALVALVVNYRRLKDLDERRRVRLLVAGWGVGVLARLPSVAISTLPLLWPGLWPDLGPAFFSSLAPIILTILEAAYPLSFAYAILHNRSNAPSPPEPSSPN